jgi:diaminopimelate epimerase
MRIKFSKYEGTGNDFIIIDNRNKIFDQNHVALIQKLCNRRFGIGADGFLLLNTSDKYDYNMAYFNADGNLGSMCGNGGRCLAAYAKRLGIIHSETTFDAIDGIHFASIKMFDDKNFSADVSLKMSDVINLEKGTGYYFLNTGSPHYIKFVDDPEKIDVVSEGRKIRNSERFIKEGVNVNFISLKNEQIYIRTYERGVEDETLSCGTGAVASVLAVADKGWLNESPQGALVTKGGNLIVRFEKTMDGFQNVFLEGHATFVFDGEMEIGK